MKTLHSIFHKGILRNYAVILVGTLISLGTGLLTSKAPEDSGFLSFLNGFAFVLAAFGPLAIFLFNNDFPHNVKFLINQHFNRSELLKFFLFSQTLKVGLAVVNYSALGLLLYIYNDEAMKTGLIPDVDHALSVFFLAFILILSCLYVFYSFALFGANKQDVRKTKTLKSLVNKNKRRKWRLIFVFLAVFYLTTDYTFPEALMGYAWCLFVSYTSLAVVNRSFKLVHQGSVPKFAGMGSFVICLPLLGILYGMRVEAQDPEIPYKTRAHSVTLLDWMSPDFSEAEMLGFLKEADDGNYDELLNLFGDKVDFDSSLRLVDTERRGKAFIDFHSRKYPQDKVKRVVSHMSKLMRDRELDFTFAYYSHSFFKEQKVDEAYIKRLVKSRNPYEQLASIYFAKRSFDKKKFLEFYKRNLAALDGAVINNRYVKRSVASERD